MKIIYLFFFLLLGSTLTDQEICDNGIDDDGDTLVDLQDPGLYAVVVADANGCSTTADFELADPLGGNQNPLGLDYWDGAANGKPIAPGVYLYVIQLEFFNGQTLTLSGDVTVPL